MTRARAPGPAGGRDMPDARTAPDRQRSSKSGTSRPEQRALGNRAAQRIIQAKLAVGASDDRFEREADRVADRVLRMPLPDGGGVTGAPALAAITPRVQRRPVEEDEDQTLQAKASDNPAGPQWPGTQGLAASLQSGGQPLPDAQRAFFEPRFGVDFGGVRIHRDGRAAQTAHGLGAQAYTLGRNVVFGRGEYRPGTEPGRRLIAHELVHVVQQGASGHALASVIQRQQPTDAELRRRLRARQAELARLRPQAERLRVLSDPTARLAGQRPQRVPRATGFVSDFALRVLQRVITVQQSGATIRLRANMQITFQGQTTAQGRARAQTVIPRLVSAIRNSWTVNMTEGPYLGHTFILEPVIAYRPPAAPGRADAWQIAVRATGGGATAATWWNGLVDMNPDHLAGDRIVVIAHELYHLFGALDTYIDTSQGSAVGRPDPANRPDLLGLVDPVALQNRLQQGQINQAQFDLQTGSTPRVWVEDATVILRALGVRPPQGARLQQAAQDLDDEAVEDVISPFARRRAVLELVEQRRRLAEVRARRARTETSMRWLETVDRILQLEGEVARLRQQLGQPPAPQGGP